MLKYVKERLRGVSALALFWAIVALFALYEPHSESEERLRALAIAEGIDPNAAARFEPRERDSGCLADGPYPDRSCTPGAAMEPDVAKICASGYTALARHVSGATKRAVFAEYGIALPQPVGSYEVDHFVPLELGGSNDVANLFPQAASPPPGFREKDVVENYLHAEACAGRLSLSEAQSLIAADWVKVYQSLSPAEIAAIEKKFGSWARRGP